MGILKIINKRILEWATTEDNPKWKLYEKILLIIEGIAILIPIIIFLLNFFRPESQQLLEPPIIIVKTNIRDIKLNPPMRFGYDGAKYAARAQLIDSCGQMIYMLIAFPSNISVLHEKQKNLIEWGYRNLSYSISVFTNRKKKFELRIFSHDTGFYVEKKIGLVKETGESRYVEGLYEKYYEVDLSKMKQDFEALFNIVPEKEGGDIDIECVDTDCEIVQSNYLIYIVPDSDNVFTFEGTNNSKVDRFQMKLPERNFSKLSLYEYDFELKRFEKINVDKPSNNTYTTMDMSETPCDKEGKIYVHLPD